MITSGPESNRRSYRSRLRDEQADQTRVRILEAAAEVMTDPSERSFTIDRVAKRAGVAVRTVYHHFADREALIQALDAFIDERLVGSDRIDFPDSLADFPDTMRATFESFDKHEVFIRAHLISQAGREVRSFSRAARRERILAILKEEAPGATPQQLRLMTALVHYLFSSEAWRSLKDESGLSATEAADAVTWAVATLVKDLAAGMAMSEHGDRT